MVEVSTSILSIEKEKASKIFCDLEIAGTDYYHIDVMDGKFVKKNTEKIMYEYANTIKHISNIPLDVHLMVQNVKETIDKYIPLYPSIITFHYEACKNKEEVGNLIKYIKENNIKPAISIKPKTPVEEILEFMSDIYLCLIMTIEPGKGGQKLIPETVEKIKEIKNYLKQKNLDTYIQVDGGIKVNNAKELIEAGADILVSGSEIIFSQNMKQTIRELKKN